jgi:hypothetical protein
MMAPRADIFPQVISKEQMVDTPPHGDVSCPKSSRADSLVRSFPTPIQTIPTARRRRKRKKR